MELYNNDCFNVFKKIEPDSVNLVVVDLPYGQTNCKWDTCINLEEMWKELKRICKKKCIYAFFTTTKFGYHLIKSNEKWFRYDLVWEKSRKVGFLSANKMPLRKHEMIYIFSDDKTPHKIYNPQKEKLDKPLVVRRSPEDNSVYGKVKRKTKEVYNEVHPSTILEYKNPSKPIHRTQKPIDLLEFLVKSYSNEGDTILDITMGSGSCGLACLNTKRNFIGIEKDTEIFHRNHLRPFIN